MPSKAMVINERDNVATAMADLRKDELFSLKPGEGNFSVRVTQDIPFGHKFALAEIPKGGEVIKYGESIGVASRRIGPGEHVHVHNLESRRGRGDMPKPAPSLQKAEELR